MQTLRLPLEQIPPLHVSQFVSSEDRQMDELATVMMSACLTMAQVT